MIVPGYCLLLNYPTAHKRYIYTLLTRSRVKFVWPNSALIWQRTKCVTKI